MFDPVFRMPPGSHVRTRIYRPTLVAELCNELTIATRPDWYRRPATGGSTAVRSVVIAAAGPGRSR